nr:putative ribonuclease H-like domain-containing protein [Tanacetum cinerariifolium]
LVLLIHEVKTVNEDVRLQALIDGKNVIVNEASIRCDLRLDDAEGTTCLPNVAIFEELTRMGYEKPSQKLTFNKAFISPQWKFLIHTILQCLSAKTTDWNEFSSTMASAIICLANNQKFKISKYIFESMMKNLEVASEKVAKKEVSTADPVTTAGEVVTTADVKVSAALTTTTTIDDELTLARTLIEIKAAKPKNAVKARFGGNAESKKMRKSLLKQEFSKFKIGEAKGLHKGYDRMQKILSQLNQLKAKPEDEDINLKFLRALPSSWSQTLEVDVKGYTNFFSSQSASPSHSAFVSTTSASKKISYEYSSSYSSTTTYTAPSNSKTGSHRSGNVIEDVLQSFVADTEPEQQLAYEYFEQIEKLDLEEIDLKWQMAMLSVRVHKFEQKAGRKIDFDKKESARFNKKKVRYYKCQQRGHFARECRAKVGNDKQRYSSFKIMEIGKKEEDSKALITVDTLNDWTDHDGESDGVIAFKEFGMIAGCDTEDAIEKGAAKIYNLITGADTEEASTAGDAGEFALMGVTSEVHNCPFGYDNKENELGWDDSAFSVFTTNYEDVEGRPLFNRFAKTNSMKAVPPPLSGDYTSLSDHIDLDKSSEVNTNDFASSDSSVKSSEPKPNDSTSCASTSSVSTSANEAEIGYNVGTPIQEPIIVQDLPSFSYNSFDKNENTSRTSCNKNGYFNKKAGNFRKNASSVSKLCFVCGSGTHLIKDCDFYETQMVNKTVDIGVGPVHSRNTVNHQNQFVPQAVLLRTGKENPFPDAKDEGVFDSGCSRSMTSNKKRLDDFQVFQGRKVTFRGGEGRITGKGTIRTLTLDFENVYYVKELQQFNLFSISQICDKKNRVLFTDTECLVLSKDFKLPDESMVVLKVPKKHNLYTINLNNLCLRGNLACFVAHASVDESMKWHRRMGHVNYKNMNRLVKGNLVRGLPLNFSRMTIPVLHVVKASNTKPLIRPLMLFCWVFFLEHKDETYPILKDFINIVENQLNKKREYSNARTPQQNEVAERKNRTLIKAARTMLAGSKLPTMFWTEAVRTACYVLNRLLVTSPHNKTPYALLTGNIPSVSHFKPFGCHVTILNTSAHLGKFDGKADKGYIVGYSTSNKAYRVYNVPNKRVEETMNLRFLEEKPNVPGLGHEWYFDLDYSTDTLGYKHVQANHSAGTQEATTNPAGTQDTDSDSECDEQVIIVPSYSSYSIQGTAPTDTSGDAVDDSPLNSADEIFQKELARLKGQEQRATSNAESLGLGFANDAEELQKRASVKAVPHGSKPVPTGSIPIPSGDTMVSTDDVLIHTGSPTDSFFDDEPTTRFLSPSDLGNHDPSPGIFSSSSYDDELGAALNNVASTVVVSLVATKRINTIHPQSLIVEDHTLAVQTRSKVKQTTTVEPRSVAQALEDPRWVDVMQEEMQQFKFQNVWVFVDLPEAQGHQQEEGIDYDEVFAPVARIKAIGQFLAFASYMGFMVYQMDVKSAFLYGRIDEEVYVTQPKGFVDPQHPKKVYKAWCDEFEALMKGEFQMSAMGELTFFLGLQVQQRPDGILINQDKYVQGILNKFDLGSVRTITTPYEAPKPKSKNESDSPVNVHLYRSVIEAVKKIFKYLKGQPNLGLWYPRESPLGLEAYSDSDHAGANKDQKSTNGGCQFLGRRLISWQCKKQTIVATSSTEAEYVAAANCCADDGGIDDLPIAEIYYGIDNLGYVTEGKLTFFKNKFFTSMEGHPMPLLTAMLSQHQEGEGAGVVAQAIPQHMPAPDQPQDHLSTPPREQTSDPNALVFKHGQSSDPNIAFFSRTHETDADPFTNVEDEPLGGSFHMSPPRTTKRKMVVSDSDQEEGGKQDVDLDALLALDNAVVTVDSNISPGDASNNPAASTNVLADVPTGASNVPTDSTSVPADVPTGVAPVGVSNKGKAPMVEEDITVKERLFKQMQKDILGEQAAKRLHDEDQAQADKQRAELQRRRQQEVLASAMRKYLGRNRLTKPKSKLQELDLDAGAQTFIKVVSDEDSEDKAPRPWSALVGWKVITTPLGAINALYRIDQSTKHFTTLRQILHMVDRHDLVKLYGLVVKYYENHPVAGAGLISEVVFMFTDVSYPFLVKLMERMLTHKLEIDKDVVGNDMTTAEQLIRFIKNQLAAAQVSST